METSHEPIDAINEWQEWFRANSYDPINKTTNNFADTIVEASTELSPEQIYSCLLKALIENKEHCEKEFNQSKKLLDLVTKDVTV